MNKKDLKAALEWQMEMGVADSFSNSILPRKVAPEVTEPVTRTGSIQDTNKISRTPHPNPLPQGARELYQSFTPNDEPRKTAFNEPAVNKYQPSKPSTMNKQPSTNNVEFLNHSNGEWINKAKELADKATTLEELKKAVEGFDGLAIKKTATNTVFGEGNPNSKVMFIGEAPGENEDLEGRPFCGLSGQLLDKMLRFIGLTRAENFYITNTLFWRPPGNRKPTPEELAICKPFVEKHIALINPKVIVLVGSTATTGVLNSKDSISLLRKVMSDYNSPVLNKIIPCFAIYHPSYLLRSPSQKKVAWGDMIKIKKYLLDIAKS
jgi:uracil-DNA glycosylase